MYFLKIAIELIIIPEENNYKDSDNEILVLKANIKRIGLQTPLTVYRDSNGKYNVVHGSRRLRAIRVIHDEDLGLFNEIPCYVVDEPKTRTEKKDFVAVNNFYTRTKTREISMEEFICIYDGCKGYLENKSYGNAMSEIELLISDKNKDAAKYRIFKEVCDAVIIEFKEAFLNKQITFDVFIKLRKLNFVQQLSLFEMSYEVLPELTVDDIDEFLAEWRSDDQKEIGSEEIVLDETNRPFFVPMRYVDASLSDFESSIEELEEDEGKEIVIELEDEKNSGEEKNTDLMKFVETGDRSEYFGEPEEDRELEMIDSETKKILRNCELFRETEKTKDLSTEEDTKVMIRRSFFSKAAKTIDFYNAAVALYMREKSKEVDFSLRQEAKKQLDNAVDALRSTIKNICDEEDLENARSVTGIMFSDLEQSLK